MQVEIKYISARRIFWLAMMSLQLMFGPIRVVMAW